MKKSFKTVLSLLACAALLFTGCSGGVKTTGMPMSSTDRVSISISNHLSFPSQNDYSWFVDEDARDAWVEYMSEHNNTDFTVYIEDRTETLELVTNGEREGIVLIDSPVNIKLLAKEGKIFPLDDYLSNNEAWNALPEEFRNTFKIDGKIYAIPYSEDVVLNSGLTLNWELAVNTVWLDQLGLEMPKTLDDFAAAGKKFAQNDMNGDGAVGNDYLLGHFYAMENFHILQSFGLYCDPVTMTSLGYDPGLGSIVDSLYNENTESALNYLLQLLNDGAIDPSSTVYFNMPGIDEDISAGKYGSVMTRNGAHLLQAGLGFAADNYERLTGKPYDPANPEVLEWAANVFQLMPPLSTEHPLTYSNSLYGYVLTAATPMPKEVINRFIDLCYGLNKTTYLECNFGAERYTLQSDGSCSVDGYDPSYGISVGTPERSAYPNLGGYYKNSVGECFVPFSPERGGGVDYARTLLGLNKKVADYIDQYKAVGLMVEAPSHYRPSGPAFEAIIISLVRRGSYSMSTSMADGLGTVHELLEEYRTDAVTTFDLANILRESNEILGLPNVQKFK